MERGGNTAVTVAGGNTGTATLTGRFGIGSGSVAMSGLITLGDINGSHDLTMYALSSGPHYTGGIVGNGNLNVSGSGATLFLDSSGPGVNFNGTMNVGALGNTVDVSAVIGPNVTAVNQLGGTLQLRGINTYVGDTTITGGTLNLFDNAGLLFAIGTSGVNNSILGTATVNFNGDFYFDLTSAGMNLGDTWNIVNVATLNESFGSTFTVNGFNDIGGNLWEFINGPTTYTFSESTGLLVVTAAASTVPEPGALILAALGMLGLGVVAWRRKRGTWK